MARYWRCSPSQIQTRKKTMEKVERAIRNFDARVREIERVTEVMAGVLSMAPECELHSTIWSIIGGYLEALGAAYHIEVWLEWWWMECGLGQRPKQAGLPGEELRMIANIDDLVRLICDDLAQAA